MNTRVFIPRRLAAVPIVIALATAGSLAMPVKVAAAGPNTFRATATTYVVKKLPTTLVANGMTASGTIFGYASGSTTAAIMSESGKVTQLPGVTGQSMVFGGAGHFFVGEQFNGSVPIRWTVSATTISAVALHPLAPGDASIVDAVAQAGDAVGQSGTVPVLWKSNSLNPITLPVPAGYNSGQAQAIDGSGSIIGGVLFNTPGFAAVTWTKDPQGRFHAHLLSGNPNGVQGVDGAGDNVGGPVGGVGDALEWVPQAGHPGVYSTIDLGGQATYGCIATGINNGASPTIVGDCNNGKIFAWVYAGNHTLTNLQPLIQAVNPGVTNTRALSVDNKGQILVEGQGSFGDYLLTPTA